MKLKIDKEMKRTLDNIAEMEFCPVETIIKRGLKIFIDYQEHKDISEYLRANKAEVVIEDYKKELNMTDSELIFAIIEAYRHEILGISLKERIKLNGGEVGTEAYVFENLPIDGKSVYLAKKDKSFNEYLAEANARIEMEHEETVKKFIKEAERQLKVLEGEYNILEGKQQEYKNIRIKLVNEVKVLKATELFKFNYKERAEHKRKIEQKEKKLQKYISL